MEKRVVFASKGMVIGSTAVEAQTDREAAEVAAAKRGYKGTVRDTDPRVFKDRRGNEISHARFLVDDVRVTVQPLI